MTTIRLLLATALATVLAALALVVLTPTASYACSCALGSEAQQRAWADVVFDGTLTHVEPPPQREVMSSSDPKTYRFTVHDVTKGRAPLVAEVRSAMLGASCGLEGMRVGATYAVYATRDGDELWSGLCSGTRETAAPAIDPRPTVDGIVDAVLAALRGFLRL